MTKIAIIYHSGTGNTDLLARAIHQGADLSKNTDVTLYRILPEHIEHGRFIAHDMLEDISTADAMIFGSPTYMGSVSAQLKAFLDATGELWGEGGWTNKIAAGFTIGSHYSGDQLSTVQYLQLLAGQHGMLWVGLDVKGLKQQNIENESGASSGLITFVKDNKLSDDALNTAHYLGERIASITQQIRI